MINIINIISDSINTLDQGIPKAEGELELLKSNYIYTYLVQRIDRSFVAETRLPDLSKQINEKQKMIERAYKHLSRLKGLRVEAGNDADLRAEISTDLEFLFIQP